MNWNKVNTNSPMVRLLVWNIARRRRASRAWWMAGMKRAAADLAWFAVEFTLCMLSALAIVFALWLFVGGR